MKKLELNLEDLQVDSFDTQARPHARGTVLANDSEPPTEGYSECTGCNTGAGSGCDTNDAVCWANTWGGRTCDTTCAQIICGCSAYDTDCDATCINYVNSPAMSCYC
ncbi:MAG: hypothetical protein ACJ8GN_00095 [Longimicrobiaceae bacterium]